MPRWRLYQSLRWMCMGMVGGIGLFWALFALYQAEQRVLLALLPMLGVLLVLWQHAEEREGWRRLAARAEADVDVAALRVREGSPAEARAYLTGYAAGCVEMLENAVENL